MSIDSTYEDVIKRLTDGGKIVKISADLRALTTNHERVLFVYDILKDMKMFPNILKVEKSDPMSTYYRNLGNKHFQKSEDYEAWQYYNLSLLYAPITSENYILALSNRSAVFYSLEKYAECLEDIEMVLSMPYPEKIKQKIEKRKIQCKEPSLTENEENAIQNEKMSEVFTLQGPRDSVYVSASSKLKVEYSPEMGRHVIASEDIKVGEVLVEEMPYLQLVLKSQLLFSCGYCLSRTLNLYPCPTCCYTLYCSKSCEHSAWMEYHKYECPLMPVLVELDFTKLEWLALRTTIKAKTDHRNWTDLFKTIEDAESTMNSEHWGQVKIDDKWVYDSKYYASIHTLATNVELRSPSDIFQRCVTAAVFLYFLTFVEFLKAEDKELKSKIKNYVAGNLLHHSMTSSTNMHGISSNAADSNGNYVDEMSIASAPYAFFSLLNHSCAPNVVRYNKLGSAEMTLLALRPIKKGMQIFDNYGSHHALESRQSRQRSLKQQYKFTCLCTACTDNWPTYMNLKLATKLPPKILNKINEYLDYNVIEKLQKGDKETALKMFKPLCELAEELESFIPCKELSDCQETLKQCLAIFEGVVPYGCNNIVRYDNLPLISGKPAYKVVGNLDTLDC